MGLGDLGQGQDLADQRLEPARRRHRDHVGQLFGEDISINPARIFFKRAQLLGVGSVSRAQLADVIALTAQGALKPLVGRILPLQQIAEAHRLVEEAAVIGRVVVTP